MTVHSVQPALDLAPGSLAPRLERFLAQRWGEPVRLSAWRRFPAGFSWVTIGCTATLGEGGAQPRQLALIVRIGDPRGLLAPYRAEPEYQVLAALQAVPGLPVPEVHAFSDDAEVIGAPFLVTGHVAGDTPMPWRGDAEQREAVQNTALAQEFTDALAALHGVDWRATPLARLWGDARPATVAREQVRHWARHAGMLAQDPAPAPPQMHFARRWLEREAPPADRVTLVHGDFRVGNFLQLEGHITAILDWELVHAGDPHEDLAWAGLRIFAAGTPRIGGLIEREAFTRRYAERAGFVPVPGVVRYYEVLGLFKSAAMLLGAARRIESGQARDIRMASMGFQLASTLLELNRLIAEAL